MPTVIREFAVAFAGEVSVVTAGAFSSGELLTAVRNGSDNLELIVWRPDATNRTLTRGPDSGTQAREVGEIALAMMGDCCITAVQNANGYLLLIPWRLEQPDGTISRLEVADHQAGKASNVTIAPLSDSLAATAVRNGAGNLLLIPWSFDRTTGHVSRLNLEPAQGGFVGYFSNPPPTAAVPEGPLIACGAIDDSDVMTAKINVRGELELAAWEFDGDFSAHPWAQFNDGRVADFLCVAPLGGPGPVRDFVLAFRELSPIFQDRRILFKKELVVTIWRISKTDATITKVAEASGGLLASMGMAAGVGLDGRTLMLVSGVRGNLEGVPELKSTLIDTTFRLISDSVGRAALIKTGGLHDPGTRYARSTVPVFLEPGRFAKAAGYDYDPLLQLGLGVAGYNVSDLSATLIRPIAEGRDDDASAIQLKALNSDQALVALRSASGTLELIGWQLAARDFAVTRAADTSASDPIGTQEVALAVVGQRAVTAIMSGSGRLRLDSWDVAADLSSIAPLHQTGTAAGNADLITATVLEPDLVVTAVRNASGKLLLIVWRLEDDGTLSRLNHENAQAGEISGIALATLDDSNVITAVINGSGHLQVIGWQIGADGTVDRWSKDGHKDGHAGDVSDVTVAALGGTGSTRAIITAVRDGSDGLLLIAWQVSVDDRTITRLCDSGDQGHFDGDSSNLSLCLGQSSPSGREAIVTMERRGSKNLKVITWELLDDPSGIPMLVQTGDMTNRADTEIELIQSCSLQPGRIAVAARLKEKHHTGFWLSTMQVSDAQAPAAPANILELQFDNLGPPILPDTSWAASGGKTYPTGRDLEWAQVADPKQEYEDDATLIGASGWVVAPENSGGDVPFSHPFGFDWEFEVALDSASHGLLSPANAGADEEEDSPNHNTIALADQLGLTVPEGLLGVEWDLGVLPTSYRGQVNHGDRVAMLGRWILDQGHSFDGFYRTEIHPPLLVASAAVVQPQDQSVPRTKVLFMSRPYLSGQTYTTNLDTRDRDGVDDDGPLWDHAQSELWNVVFAQSTMIENYPKIKSRPFRGAPEAHFVIRPPGSRPEGATLMVSYRFTVRTPCQVTVELFREPDRDDAVRVTVDLRQNADGHQYRQPDLPPRRQETYSTDEMNLLSSGSGDRIAIGEDLVEALVALAGVWVGLGVGYAIYVRRILKRGMNADVFDALPEIDVLDPTGGVADVPVTRIAPGAGVILDDTQHYPVTGWLEAYWGAPVIL